MPIHKVLIVDDSKTEIMFLTELLQKNGFVVRSAENADEAFKRLSEEKPDLILIYRKPDDVTLELSRLGSHSELGL